jgi:hypothetical protein
MLASLLVIGSGLAHAAPVARLLGTDCKPEIETHCKDVTLGHGRLNACLYAFSDKLSGQCLYAVYQVMDQLELVAARIRYVANVCGSDIKSHCIDTPVGGGRILKCLGKNEAKISAACNQALNDTGSRGVIEFAETHDK